MVSTSPSAGERGLRSTIALLGVRSTCTHLPVVPSTTANTALPSVAEPSISLIASSSVRACSSTVRASSAIGRAVRVTRTSTVRAGSTITAMPSALIPVITPSKPGQPTLAHAIRPSGRAIVTTGSAESPPSSSPGSATARPIHTRAGDCACAPISVRLRAIVCWPA